MADDLYLSAQAAAPSLIPVHRPTLSAPSVERQGLAMARVKEDIVDNCYI